MKFSLGKLVRISATALCGLLLAPAIASGTAIYGASTTLGTAETAGVAVTSTGVLTTPFPYGTGTITHQEFAAAGPGGLRASARATVNASTVTVLGSPSGNAFATASLHFDDILITGPTTGTVPVSLNLTLDGTLQTSAILNGILIPGISSSIFLMIDGTLAGNSFSGAFDQTEGIGVNPSTGVHTPTKVANYSGILAPGALPATPVSPVFDLPVGVPLDLTLRLSVNAGWQVAIGGTAGVPSLFIDSLSDFSNTLTLGQTAGPVFNLPSGYSVHSAQAGIQGNLLVPEPRIAALLLFGATALLGAARRQATS